MCPRTLYLRRLLLALGAIACAAGVASAQPYEAWRKDGAKISGNQVQALYDSGNGAKLEGHVLYDGNPVRMLRNLAVALQPGGAVVEMTNGDRLPGRVVGREAASGDPPRPARLLVALDGPPGGAEIEPGTIAVKEALVRRILVPPAELAPYEPGRVQLIDGRAFVARQWKFTQSGLSGLSGEGVVQADYMQIRRADFPRGSDAAELMIEAAWKRPEHGPPLVRITTARGAELSFPRIMARPDDGPWLAIRPVWAVETIRVRQDRIAWHLFREPHEIPLSCLAGEPVSDAKPAGRSADAALRTKDNTAAVWRIGVSARGGELRSGERASPAGFGTHAPSAIGFELPPGAQRFSAWVGIDRAAGRGGCATVRVRRDSIDGPELWKGEFLRGGAEPVRVGPLDLAGAKRLVLVTEVAHQGRPAGADPLDIRDDVDWLLPLVELDPARVPKPGSVVGEIVPALAGFQLAPEQQDRIAFRPAFGRKRWVVSMVLDGELSKAEPLLLSREVQVTLANARLVVAAGREKSSGAVKHKVQVLVDGKQIDSTLNGDLLTKDRSQDDERYDSREYGLGPFVGRKVKVTLAVSPSDDKHGKPSGILWGQASLSPLVEDLPADHEPLRAHAPLTSLVPEKNDKKLSLVPGKTTDGKPLTLRGVSFAEGVGLPTGTELTYRLDPSWRRFVAVLGLAEGWQGTGFEILLDGKSTWKSAALFDRNAPGRQLDLPIPPGHERITIRVTGRESFGALGNAGFRTE